MFCSPLIHPERSRLPAPVREWIGRRLGGPVRRATPPRDEAVLYAAGRLGDFVLALSTIRLFLDHWGAGRCTLVVSDLVADLAALELPDVRRIVVPLDAPGVVRDVLPLRRRLRPLLGRHPGVRRISLLHQRTLFHEIALSWIPAEEDHRLTPATYPAAPGDGLSLELEAHRRLAEAALGRPVKPAEVRPRLRHVTATEGDTLLLCPLASQAGKSLPVTVLAEALGSGLGVGPWRLRVAGSPAQRAQLEPYQGVVERAGLPVEEPLTTTDLALFVRAVARAGAVLAVDSFAAHLALALDKRACIVLGGGRPDFCLPWHQSGRQHFCLHRLPCFGCGWRCSQPSVLCLEQMPPAHIRASLAALLPAA